MGRGQDSQAFYEDRATDEIIAHSRLDAAHSVFEFGCGTGRFAEELLARRLPAEAVYRAVDVSPVMIDLAQARLAPFAPRAAVRLTDGRAPVDEPSGAYDRFFSNFVLDLLAEDEIAKALDEAHRMLRPGGLLGLCSLTPGFTVPSRLVSWIWTRIHAVRPSWVGGCRPISLPDHLDDRRWKVCHHARIAPWGVPLETLVAQRL